MNDQPKMTELAAKVMLNEARRHSHRAYICGLCPRCKAVSHTGKCVGASRNPALRAKVYRLPRIYVEKL